MGWWKKIAVGVLGMLLIGSLLWPVALACFLYLAITLWPRREGSGPRSHVNGRLVVSLVLFGLAAVALVSGGTLSPIIFSFLGGTILFWPSLRALLPVGEVVPVRDSVLLRSRYFPFAWLAVAELKPGSDSFARAVSAFTGTLLVFTDSGRAFVLATCNAGSRATAEEKLIRMLRVSLPDRHSGAYLLPLDSGAAMNVLRQRFSKARLSDPDLVKAAPRFSGALVLECSDSKIRAARSFATSGPARVSALPGRGGSLDSPPLIWEVVGAIEERTRWPEPDSFSSLLDSLNATRGVPLGERLKVLESNDGDVSLESLGGAQVLVTRPQLRAIVSLYS